MKEKEEYKEVPITLRKIELISPEEMIKNIYNDTPEINEDDLLPSPDFVFDRITSPEELFSKINKRKKIEKLPNKKK